ncbi:MAG: lipoate--protein ligase [Kiritimatiellales bacterium]|nr:lipoate--protein ligase [Kiritimatiellales bacterium]
MLIVESKSTDVYRNLAVEEWLLDHAQQLPVLFLYVNDPCVVIGKNQNPWRECKLTLMEEEAVPLARRISGGGAVYHDPGNLNVSVMVPRTEYVEQKQYDLIFQALETFGIKSSKVRKTSLAVDGLKFSGQAFCHRRDRTLHHGTQLINCDLSRLGRYLGPELDGIETKAVASVPAEVANLSQFAPELTVEKLSAALIETFQMLYNVPNIGNVEIPEAQLLPMIGKNSSKDWKLGHTPKFTFRDLEVERGRVVNREGSPPFDDWRKENATDI